MSDTIAIGRPTPLVDGRAKALGATRYATDLTMPGMLHARFVTSSYAHARILDIDVGAALETPGVVAVLTAQDLPEIEPTGRHLMLLARERVIFVGQPIALVLAESEAAAQDGADLVFIDYDPLPVAMTIEAALADDAPLVWPDGLPGESEEAGAHGAEVGSEDQDSDDRRTNFAGSTTFTQGNVEQGFAAADVVVERTFTTPQVHQSYLEPHATLAQLDPLSGGITMWTSTQAPFYIQEEVAKVLDVPVSDVRVVATPIGGAFGGKFILYEPLVALAAKVVNRPVRLVLTRGEEMLAGNPAPEAKIRLRIGAHNDGTLVAMEGELLFDSGCYPGSPMGIAAVMLGSQYRVPNVMLKGKEVVTFKASQGAYRAPGAPQATFALETLIDELAHRLDMDPFQFRLKNIAAPGDRMVHNKPWPLMGAREVLERLREHPAWQHREEARAAGRGVGIAIGGWLGGTEPAAAACKVERDGTVHLHIGSVDLNGTDTTFMLLAAEAFGTTPDKVRIIKAGTASDPYAGGAGGSKITYTVGPAVIQAAREAREQLLAIAAEELEAAPDDLEIEDGRVTVRGVPDQGISIQEIVKKTTQFGGRYAPIFGHGRHADRTQSPGFCAQLAEVEVDSDTGRVQVHRLVVVQDVGRAINPPAIEGQMMGGAAQGLGWALYERMAYDEQGQLLTGSLMDYGLPLIHHVAPLFETEIVEVPSEYGPMGAKGVGEPPVIPTAAAVANAVADAAGVRMMDLPMTAPRVLEALHASG
jgi:CO/xanthine dehydrogenase Mo-binding subunit